MKPGFEYCLWLALNNKDDDDGIGNENIEDITVMTITFIEQFLWVNH